MDLVPEGVQEFPLTTHPLKPSMYISGAVDRASKISFGTNLALGKSGVRSQGHEVGHVDEFRGEASLQLSPDISSRH